MCMCAHISDGRKREKGRERGRINGFMTSFSRVNKYSKWSRLDARKNGGKANTREESLSFLFPLVSGAKLDLWPFVRS